MTKMPSWKRPLARYMVESPSSAGNYVITSARVGRHEYLGSFELAGGMIARLNKVVSSARPDWHNSTR